MFDSMKDSSSRFLNAWFAGGLASVIFPLILFGAARLSNSYNYNQYNNNNNNDNGNNNNNNDNGGGSPWWYWGSHQGEDGRDDESAPPVLVAAYLWSLMVFFGVMFYGYREIRGQGDHTSVIVALVMFACYSFISMIVFGSVDGAVETEGRVVEEHGFMGQFGVMMYITSLFWLVFTVTFAFLLHRQAKEETVTKVEVDSSQYRIQNDTV